VILRRYGSTLESVVPRFEARALSEIGFRRDGIRSAVAEDFFETHEKVEERELTAEAEGPVQDEAEEELLQTLEAKLRTLEEGLSKDEVVVLLNDRTEHPKTKDLKEQVLVEGQNRFYFRWRVEPPLRVGIYRLE